MTSKLSPRRRRDIIEALRRGTVPENGLDVMAVGLDSFVPAIDDELRTVSEGGAQFKALRGGYGSGKTFFSRWLTERAKTRSFATAEVQVSEKTPLYKLETVYRRIVTDLRTDSAAQGAFREVVDGWFYLLDQDAREGGATDDNLAQAADELMESRLAGVSRTSPVFAQVMRAYRRLGREGRPAEAEALLAWLTGEPGISAAVKREAGAKGELDSEQALGFLQGLLTVLRDSDYAGLVLVLDEVETLQRTRTDVREKSLNGLRQLMDDVDAGRFPGLYVLMTGTPEFYDGPNGVRRLAPLAQRLETHFDDPRWDNPRAVQIRLLGFDLRRLVELGSKVRDIYASSAADPERIRSVVDDDYVTDLATAVAGELGAKVGVAPRLFLKKLVADVLDRVDQFADFDPRQHYTLTISEAEMAVAEREATRLGDRSDPRSARGEGGPHPHAGASAGASGAVGAADLDEIDLDLDEDS
ncbi:BREX system ATP-binding protein BrxD [Brevibacterium litoralis]|uniref:BREX system ATP-binding protein BrxD n=1 Tax=Brevibacterium litoralis TaxID=3138935 RepID=UPI0032ED508A